MCGVIGIPSRTGYSASKFAMDGFGKALQAELFDTGIIITQIYPIYVRTDIAKNALLGDGTVMGKQDSSIGQGIPVDEACDEYCKAIFFKRTEYIIGSLYFHGLLRFLSISEWGTYFYGGKEANA